MNIQKRTGLITGASRGLGRALVKEALRRGARRVYAGTRGTLQHAEDRVTPLTLDVTSVSQIQRGPIDTDMSRGLEVPEASPESAAVFEGLEQGGDEIFPDPASLSIADGWRTGTLKSLERQFAGFVPQSAASLG